jgi:predicted aspartyl protease
MRGELSLLLRSRKLVLAATAAEAYSMNRWLLTLACLSLFFPSLPSQADDQPRASENAYSSELPFRLSSGHLIQVEGRIGNQTHLKFILDTGASISIVDQRIAEKFKLDAHPATSFNFDRNLKWEMAILPDVQFGPIRAANVVVLVGDLARYSELARKADAIIGMDLLNLSNVTIDFVAGNLIFDLTQLKTYLAGGDPLTECPIVELQIQGRPVRLIADTGFSDILLYEERLRKDVPGLRTAGSAKNATLGGRVQIKQATLPDVFFGNRNRAVRVFLLPSPAAEMLPGIDGIMGIAALQARRVHFDFSSKTLSWE